MIIVVSAFQFLFYSSFVNFLGFYFVFQVLLWLESLGDQLETALGPARLRVEVSVLKSTH